jgi:alpha-glucosidase
MEHLPQSVAAQENDPGSLLNAYRSLVRMRKSLPALVRGCLEVTETTEATISFVRRLDGEASVFCAFNLSDQPQEATLPKGNWRAIDDTGIPAETSPETITLPPHQAFFAQER